MLLTSGGWSPGMLLNIPEPPTPSSKVTQPQNVSSVEAEKPQCGQKGHCPP